MAHRMNLLGCVPVLAGLALAALPASGARPQHRFAQALVNRMHRAHPEIEEIGIAVQFAGGCRTIASTDPGDVGERCESEDRTPMRTGRIVVQREGKELDISLPLRDASGRRVGSIGMELIPARGESRAAAIRKVKAIAAAMARQIPSKARLLR